MFLDVTGIGNVISTWNTRCCETGVKDIGRGTSEDEWREIRETEGTTRSLYGPCETRTSKEMSFNGGGGRFTERERGNLREKFIVE